MFCCYLNCLPCSRAPNDNNKWHLGGSYMVIMYLRQLHVNRWINHYNSKINLNPHLSIQKKLKIVLLLKLNNVLNCVVEVTNYLILRTYF